MTKKNKKEYIKYIGISCLVIFSVFSLFLAKKCFDLKNTQKEISQKLEKLDKIEKELIILKKEKLQNDLEKEKQEKIKNLDLETDDSITKFVNNKVHYNNLAYIPENLVSVSGKHIIDSKGYIKVRKVLKENLEKLANDFYKDTNNNIIVVSGYRSYKYQKGIKDRGCPDNLCAKAGYSEHQSGLAIDIYSASSKEAWESNNNLRKYYSWFKQNAWKYGFTNTYQKGVGVDGYEIEPWHWRYVGKDLAKYLLDNDMTFAEFYFGEKEK